MTGSSWTRILSGESAEPYAQVITEVVAALEQDDLVSPTDWGRPLLHAYLGVARSSPAHLQRGACLADAAVDTLAHTTMSRTSLYQGIAGVGWLAAHMDALLGTRDDEAYEEIDRVLVASCVPGRTPATYDLISGPVGTAVYFLERLPQPLAVEGLRRVAGILAAEAQRTGDQATWYSPPAQLPAWQRELAPQGYYNLGVAHGVPGVIGILGEMRRSGTATPGDEVLLRGAMTWLLSQRLGDGTFPSWVAPGGERSQSRVAWCYGDLGLSVTFLLAARALGDEEFERAAIDIALQAAAHRHDAGEQDAALCHGTAGNAHLFNRLYQATGRAEFCEAAQHWYARTLQLRVNGRGIAGYRAYNPGLPGQVKANPWEDDTTFLTGASGIALALLAATSDVEPNWDRVLLARLT